MFIKNKVLFSLFLILGVVSFAPVSNAGWFDFLFPQTELGPDPSETLVAPFADEDAVIEDLDSQGNPEKAIPLNLRHRPNNVITQWIRNTVPVLLTYKSNAYQKEYAQKAANFTKVGSDEYIRFMQEKNILRTLKTGRYNVTGIIQDYPVIVNEGAVDGRYRWLYTVDVLITYFDSNLKNYTRDNEDDAITQEYTVTMQVGRNKGVSNEHGILIETWDVKAKKPE